MNNEKQINDDKLQKNENHFLTQMGWSPYFHELMEPLRDKVYTPARVTGVRKNRFLVCRGNKECLATVSGRLLHSINALYPVTGDWVLMNDSVITQVLPRKNALSRGAAGARGKQEEFAKEEQVLAANLDTVFIVCGLDQDFNLRRIERYLTLIYNCGLIPAIILTKADLHSNPERFGNEVEAVAFGVPVHLVSAWDSAALMPLKEYLHPNRTITMIGSSGAGKSTLVNQLSGRTVQATKAVSQGLGKGRHTTTTRDLIMMPQGGMVIDNPGIREIAFWDDDGGIDAAFPEIEQFSGSCRFSDCTHMHEPDCRVLRALMEGGIDPARLESYRKMKRELDYLSHRQRKSADRVEKERWKDVSLKIKAMKKRR